MGCYNGNNGNNNGNNGNNGNVAGANDLTPFIRQLSPGTKVMVQYDCQPPACGIYQGFQNGFVLLDDFNGFKGLTRLLPSRINAIAPVTDRCYHKNNDYTDDENYDYEG